MGASQSGASVFLSSWYFLLGATRKTHHLGGSYVPMLRTCHMIDLNLEGSSRAERREWSTWLSRKAQGMSQRLSPAWSSQLVKVFTLGPVIGKAISRRSTSGGQMSVSQNSQGRKWCLCFPMPSFPFAARPVRIYTACFLRTVLSCVRFTCWVVAG